MNIDYYCLHCTDRDEVNHIHEVINCRCHVNVRGPPTLGTPGPHIHMNMGTLS